MDQGAAQGGQVTPISFGALDARYKSIWLEGVDFNDEVTSGGSSLSDPTRIQLAQEAIQEFQVMATGYSTEFGRSAGGVINIVLKNVVGAHSGHGPVGRHLVEGVLRPGCLLGPGLAHAEPGKNDQRRHGQRCSTRHDNCPDLLSLTLFCQQRPANATSGRPQPG